MCTLSLETIAHGDGVLMQDTRLESVLGDCQKEFQGNLSTERLGMFHFPRLARQPPGDSSRPAAFLLNFLLEEVRKHKCTLRNVVKARARVTHLLNVCRI